MNLFWKNTKRFNFTQCVQNATRARDNSLIYSVGVPAPALIWYHHGRETWTNNKNINNRITHFIIWPQQFLWHGTNLSDHWFCLADWSHIRDSCIPKSADLDITSTANLKLIDHPRSSTSSPIERPVFDFLRLINDGAYMTGKLANFSNLTVSFGVNSNPRHEFW